jgi:hypothetical protein
LCPPKRGKMFAKWTIYKTNSLSTLKFNTY